MQQTLSEFEPSLPFAPFAPAGKDVADVNARLAGAVEPPERKGFGSRLIARGVTHELSAEVCLEFPPTGVVCEIDAPLG